MAHLRSNLTIRLPRAAIAGLDPAVNELQASALFVKGRHAHADGLFGHFHLQITAAGLNKPSTDSEAELFKKIPDVDTIAAFRHANDDQIVLTIRGIGEMRPNNPATLVKLAGETDEFGMPRAFVSINPGVEDGILWNAMDTAADEVALIFANGQPYEVLSGAAFQPVAADQPASAVLAFPNRRDGLGTTHHEAGTLAMGDDPNTSVTNANARFHRVPNLYAAGPSLFPTVGSPNPMLTGTALARRLADNLAAPFVAQAGFTSLFDGASLQGWRMSTIRNQPGRNDPGHFVVTNGALVSVPGSDIGLLWHAQPTPPDFLLKLEWRRWQDDANSGVFLRFPDPESRNYDNTAFVGVDFGFEVQIDQLASPDGLPIHKTAAIYGLQGPNNPNALPVNAGRRVECVRDPGAGPELHRNPERRAGDRLRLRTGLRRRPSRPGFAEHQRRPALHRTADTHAPRRLSQYPVDAAVRGGRARSDILQNAGLPPHDRVSSTRLWRAGHGHRWAGQRFGACRHRGGGIAGRGRRQSVVPMAGETDISG